MQTQPARADQVRVAPSLAMLNIHLAVLYHSGKNVLTVVEEDLSCLGGLTSLIAWDLSHNCGAALPALPPLLGQQSSLGTVHLSALVMAVLGVLSTIPAAIALHQESSNTTSQVSLTLLLLWQ